MEKKEIIKLSWGECAEKSRLEPTFFKGNSHSAYNKCSLSSQPWGGRGGKGGWGLDSKPVWARQQDLATKKSLSN